MPLSLDKTYTSDDYWKLPEGTRAELIGGRLCAMAPPSRSHQRLVIQLGKTLANHIDSYHGNCEIYPAPFAVNLDAHDKDWVEPDLSVICDKRKLTDRGCSGAPDLIIEIVSPSSRRMDYNTKNALYSDAGVREYWIVDPAKEMVTVYFYQNDAAPAIYSFEQAVPVSIFSGLSVTVADLLL